MIEVNNIKIELLEESEYSNTFVINNVIFIVTDIYLNIKYVTFENSKSKIFYQSRKEEIQRYIRQYFMFEEIKKGWGLNERKANINKC